MLINQQVERGAHLAFYAIRAICRYMYNVCRTYFVPKELDAEMGCRDLAEIKIISSLLLNDANVEALKITKSSC